MDLSLWDPPDDQDYLTSLRTFCLSSEHKNDDHLLSDFSFGYGRDVIEEDALNERSCLQVLKILVDKADEEMTKLEEDILKHHCQLAWCNESWSVPYSVALVEKIEHLNIWVRNLKNGNTEDVHYPNLQLKQLSEQPQSLDELLKPLLGHSVKTQQRNRGITQMSVLPNGGFNKEKSEVITQISVLPNGGFNKVKSEMITSEDNKNTPKTNKRKSQSMQRLEVNSMKQESRSPRKVRKASEYKHANAIDKCVPSLKMKRETSKFLETGRRHSFEFKGGEECARERKIETLQTNLAKCMFRKGKEMGSPSSSKQVVNVQQTCELVEISISQICEKETQQLPNGKDKVASPSILLPEKEAETIIRKRKYCRKLPPIKMEIEDYVTSSNTTTEETRDGVARCRNDVQNLRVSDLRAICKKRKIRGYTKLCKAELIKLVGKVPSHLL